MPLSNPTIGIQDVIYLFINCDYLQYIYSKNVKKWFENDEEEINFRTLFLIAQPRNAFYYSCLDNIQRSSESKSDFNARIIK